MGLPADEGLAVLHVLAEDWLARRQLLAAVGVKDPDRLDTVLDEAGRSRRPVDRSARVAEVAAFVAATGGEM